MSLSLFFIHSWGFAALFAMLIDNIHIGTARYQIIDLAEVSADCAHVRTLIV